MVTLAQWMRTKWSALSRLPADEPKLTEYHMPFLQETSANPENPLDTGMNISSLEERTQEVKMLRANESHQPSDTDALAKADGWDDRLDGRVGDGEVVNKL